MFPVPFIEQDHFSSSLNLNYYMLHLVPSLFFKMSFVISHGIAYILGMDDLAVKRHISVYSMCKWQRKAHNTHRRVSVATFFTPGLAYRFRRV